MTDYFKLKDRDLSILVAEKVLGWERGDRWDNGNGGWIINGEPYEKHHTSWDNTPRFASDMSAAMQIIEKFQKEGYMASVNASSEGGLWWTVLYPPVGNFVESESVPSAARAICLAALQAIEQQSTKSGS